MTQTALMQVGTKYRIGYEWRQRNYERDALNVV